MPNRRIAANKEEIASFCRKHHIRTLSFFGSVLRDDFGPESDVDVPVEFDSDARIGLIRLAGMELELSEMLGRKVDLNMPDFLRPSFRDQVLIEAEAQ